MQRHCTNYTEENLQILFHRCIFFSLALENIFTSTTSLKCDETISVQNAHTARAYTICTHNLGGGLLRELEQTHFLCYVRNKCIVYVYMWEKRRAFLRRCNKHWCWWRLYYITLWTRATHRCFYMASRARNEMIIIILAPHISLCAYFIRIGRIFLNCLRACSIKSSLSCV